jgi:general secretion pathway protein G
MKNDMRKNRPAARGFTLIEVLVVVSIIVILAAIGLAVGVQVKRTASERATKATLEVLDQAMMTYLKDNKDPGGAWLTALQAAGLMPTSVKIASGTVNDGYGNPILYEHPANQPNGFFHSYGPDGKTGLQGSTDYSADDLFSKGASGQ